MHKDLRNRLERVRAALASVTSAASASQPAPREFAGHGRLPDLSDWESCRTDSINVWITAFHACMAKGPLPGETSSDLTERCNDEADFAAFVQTARCWVDRKLGVLEASATIF